MAILPFAMAVGRMIAPRLAGEVATRGAERAGAAFVGRQFRNLLVRTPERQLTRVVGQRAASALKTQTGQRVAAWTARKEARQVMSGDTTPKPKQVTVNPHFELSSQQLSSTSDLGRIEDRRTVSDSYTYDPTTGGWLPRNRGYDPSTGWMGTGKGLFSQNSQLTGKGAFEDPSKRGEGEFSASRGPSKWALPGQVTGGRVAGFVGGLSEGSQPEATPTPTPEPSMKRSPSFRPRPLWTPQQVAESASNVEDQYPGLNDIGKKMGRGPTNPNPIYGPREPYRRRAPVTPPI